MASIEKHNGGYRIHVYFEKKRRTIWLGKTSLTKVRVIERHLHALMDARKLACGLPGTTERWVAQISPKMRNRIIAAGLMGSMDVPTTLSRFVDYFIARNSHWAPATIAIWKGLGKELEKHFGPERELASVTEADAEDCARWFRSKGHSKSHSGKQIQNTRQLFTAALRARVVYANPFHDGIDCSQPIDHSRKAYVSEETIDKLIAAADPHLAAVIATARYAGVRVPSEILKMKWEDLGWETGLACIHDEKRNRDRVLPFFQKWRVTMDRWQQSEESHGEFVFTHARSSAAKTYRDGFLELIERCELKPWPKLWHTLRASRETDLKEAMPGREHVVCEWIGNSIEVSRKHYDRVADKHYEQAMSL